ncbi:putative MFS family arabinose efflux permease [Micromonospora sp. Llam0]|uniref:MFS transporter n=1 Tax=Micromonospora sp. Llam0 TaxID=2485143 RepID=UPI000FB647C0|nr:MFS transporter [Micromonospora sp. Llam0]ROO58898.1 putative MFS family arabinose efflux permease [Micromonospora sp. Llam0]
MPVSLWRNRDFLLLWTSQVVSTLGTRISGLAYPLLVLAVTGSPAQAGLVAAAQAAPFLIWFLPAGALVDRWPRKRIMLAADAGRAVALASVAVAVALGRITIGHLMVVAFVEGTLYVFFLLAETAALPHVVPKPQLPTAIAQNQARDQGADLAGQPLGGLLFGLGHAVPFAADAVSYVLGLSLVAPIRRPLEETRVAQHRHLLAEISEGVRWLWRQHLLRALVAIASAGNLAFSALSLAVIVRATDLGASPTGVGVLLGLFGVGAIAGALVAPPVQRLVAPNVIMIGALWWWVAQMTALALAPTVFALGAVYTVGALVGPIFNTTNAAYRYALTPDRLQGRVNGASRMIGWGARPVGALLGGIALETLGAVPTFAALAAWLAVVAAASTTSRQIRQAPRPETLTEQP